MLLINERAETYDESTVVQGEEYTVKSKSSNHRRSATLDRHKTSSLNDIRTHVAAQITNLACKTGICGVVPAQVIAVTVRVVY